MTEVALFIKGCSPSVQAALKMALKTNAKANAQTQGLRPRTPNSGRIRTLRGG